MNKDLQTLKSDLEKLQSELAESRIRLRQVMHDMLGADSKTKGELRQEKHELLDRIQELPAEIEHTAYLYAMTDLEAMRAEKVRLMATWKELDTQRQDLAAKFKDLYKHKEMLLREHGDLTKLTEKFRELDPRAESLHAEITSLINKINLLPTRILQQGYRGANLDGPGSFDNAAKHFSRRMQNIAAHDL